ncbi:fibronectin type III domain-containing protein [Hymenobacter sp. ASUV-10]|uniref:Fibronectin type III domain-containing protein n=1 Tax=Hymenobacter aranciens TaxID=3063996 RepID=A0ABT9BF50_9BACT|nr:fibronectin type III domain-containing protein [Hymenobacter sp. ASUV-10]MDO7876885.1 fibronectin type III domain-containing protein [Hymenobacter sp. ASUV-10]
MSNFYSTMPRGWRALGLLCLLLLAHAGRAQVNRYTFSQAPGTYVPLGAGRTVAIDGQQVTGTIFRLPAGAIPFPFPYNGRRYTNGYLHLKGYLTLGLVPPVLDTPPLPFDPLSEPTPYDGAIAPLASNLAAGATQSGPWAEVSYQTLGTAPARTFVVQWDRMYNASSGPFAFQLRLHETTGVIEFAYGAFAYTNIVPGTWDRAQVGLRGTTPQDFANRTGTWAASRAGTSPLDELLPQAGNSPAGLVYTYTPPAPEPCPRPFALVADSLEPTSARLSWRVAGGTGPYTLRYGPLGFDPSVATAGVTVSVPAGDSTYHLTGLSSFTNYDFYLQQNCGGAVGTSVFSNPKGTFRTLLVNDNPSGAIALPLGATCVPTAGDNTEATNTTPNGWAPGNTPNPNNCNNPGNYVFDLWYSFTTDATGPGSQTVRLQASGTGAARLSVLAAGPAGGAGPLQMLACTTTGSSRNLVMGNLTASTTYYVRIAAGTSNKGAFTVCASVPAGCGDPLNPNVVNITPTTASLSFTPSTGSPASYTVTLTPDGGPTTTLTPAPTSAPIALTGLTPGTRYTATLQANCGSTGQSAVLRRVFVTGIFNDEPATAQALPVNPTCQPTAGTTLGASDSNIRVTSPCTNSRNEDAWYTFTTAATGPTSTAVRLTINSAEGYNLLVMRSAGGAAGPFTFENCNPNTRTVPFLDVTSLSPSTTYYVQVRFYTGNISGNYTICATAVPIITCDAPTGLTATAITTTGATINWLNPGLNGTPQNYELVYTAQGGPRQTLTPAPAASPATLTGLTPATYYTVRLRTNCAGTAGSSTPDSLRFRTAGAPANDLCANAQLLSCGQSVLGSCVGATSIGEATTCPNVRRAGPGVWYRIAGTGDQMTVRTCNTFADPQFQDQIQLLVFSGTCGTMQCHAQGGIDPACLGQAFHTVTFPTQAGQSYYLLVNSPGLGTPDFILNTSCILATQSSLATQVLLYPNPAHASATLELPADLRAAGPLVIYNALGQPVRQQPLSASAHRAELALSGLPAGVYSLHLRTAQGALVKRLVVE